MSPKIEAPQAPKPLPPIMQPQGSKPKQKSAQPSFLGTESAPESGPGGFGGKTLLGQ